MTYIQIDSRGCGVGKTRGTIIPRIRRNILNGIRTLVVVPSKNLQKEYATQFDLDEISVINSDQGRIIEQYETVNTPVVCITHEGFCQTPSNRFERENWELIIDEALDPYASETFNTHDSASRVWVNFDQVFSWRDPDWVPTEKPKTTPQPFFELAVVKSTPPSVINPKLWHKIANPNWRLWVTWETGNNLFNNAVQTTTIGLELCESVLDHWSSVWIAAAAFERTFMAYWMESNQIPYAIAYEFEPHQGTVNWHMPKEEFRWSKACRTANPDILAEFRDYCNRMRSGKLIYNKNRDDNTVYINSDRLPHNAHGINEFRERTDFAFSSAIQPTAFFKNFVNERCGLSGKALTFAFQGYTVYQLIMRTAIRDLNNTAPVNVFALDTEMLHGVMELFDHKHSSYFPNISVEDQRSKKKPLTPAQRQKLYRQRKRAQTNS